MSSTRTPAGNYQYGQGARNNSQPLNYGNQSNAQDFSIPSHLYVQRRSTNPVLSTQVNQPQYVDPNRVVAGYDSARAVQAQTSGMYQYKNPGTPSRNVNPALVANPPPYSQSRYATHGKESLFAKKETRAEIDDSPIIDPNAFYYLNLDEKKPAKKPVQSHPESGIDSRPIVNIDAVTQLERRRQQQIEKNNRLRGDDGSGAGIDSRPIVDINAFRHIDAKFNQNKDRDQQGQGTGGGIDNRPITNPDAFKYLESRREQKPKNTNDDSSIDTRPIINPEAFKYLERRTETPPRTNDESGIDTKPIVNPDAFRYLEQRNMPTRRDIDAGVDTTSRVNQAAFQYIEKKPAPKSDLTESIIDYRPIVNPQAFKWIERKDAPRRIDDGPDVDERSYVNPKSFQKIERPSPKLTEPSVGESSIDTRSFILDRNPKALAHLERQPVNRSVDYDQGGIDEKSYVNPQAFRYLEGMTNEPAKVRVQSSSSAGPAIDTKPYVNPNAFRHLEPRDEQPRNTNETDRGIDERSYISPNAFRHLEYTGEQSQQAPVNYSNHGQTDF